MAGYTMCSGDECPRKEQCYRYRAAATKWQSWFVKPPVDADGNCRNFIKIEAEDEIQTKEKGRGRKRSNPGTKNSSSAAGA